MQNEFSLDVTDWGLTHYPDALARQVALVARRKAGLIPDTLVFTEHYPVYTLGVRSGADRHLIWDSSQLKKAGITVVKTTRGGDITYHGPGQLVGYPIIDWKDQKDLHRYLRMLEDVLIATVAHWGIQAGRRTGKTGVWIEQRKLAAIGVAVKGWITYHGFALNVNPDLTHFSGIVPCGITDARISSLRAELGADTPAMATVKKQLSLEFERILRNLGKHGPA